jgi:predicted kinase
MIIKFSEFICEKFSKNEPIKELGDDRLCIVLMGAPGLGKSYFNTNYIQPKKFLKTFSSDDISLLYTKDHKKYHEPSGELNVKRTLEFIKTGKSFVYDTTGSYPDNVLRITKLAKDYKYKIVFIHLTGPLELSLKQDKIRDRQAGDDFIKYSYDTQFSNMKSYYTELKPDAYYIIYNKDGKYKFYLYKNGQILRRKVDKYI